MEPSGGDGEVATKRAKPSSDDAGGGGGEDRLSALPDDVLVLILLRLLTPAAAQTSVLSRRWRRVWALLPDLRFLCASDPHRIGAVLDAHEAALLYLFVETRDAVAGSAAAWLPAAARRVTGRLLFHNLDEGGGAQEDGDEEIFELPCLESATSASLHLGFLGLAVAPAGVFARLTDLSLARVRLHRPGELGDAVSSPRCPSLQKLTVRESRGLGNLTIHSDSLQQVELHDLHGLQQLSIVAPALQVLDVMKCFYHDHNQLVASISAPQLVTLVWIDDPRVPSSVQLGEMEHLELLGLSLYLVYGLQDSTLNRACLSFLRRFKVIEDLILTLAYLPKIDNYQYLMEDMTMLPDITFLRLIVLTNGHAFGASAFHVLRMCSGIRRLLLAFPATDVEAQKTCPSGCICGDQHNWETDQLLLNCLQEVEITPFRGSEHEVTFVKQLFDWATVLQKMTVTFDYSVTESMAKELCLVLRNFSRPEIRMEFYMDGGRFKVLSAPED
ncbi:unnamed protein product [Urochloa decumbens]|uniref:FBD domain-containing protein n=1 Tax=Urochloa decumbens TaxID=240449 RepID=A0ABC9CPK0_9POAL